MVTVSCIVTATSNSSSPTPITPTPATTKQLRGDVVTVVRELLAERRDDVVLDLVQRVVGELEEVKRRLAEKSARRSKGEGMTSAQLRLVLDTLEQGGPPVEEQLTEADKALQAVCDDIADKRKKRGERKGGKASNHSGRNPIPPNLRQIEDVIKVADDQRACPLCGQERECIGHDTSYTIDLIPAEVIVRLLKQEKLACKPCDGQLVRAPLVTNKVVAGGKLGSNLVAHLLHDKYRDGLPLHRIKERLARLGLDLSVSTLADQVKWSTELLRPLWRAASGVVLGAAVMQLDGTGLAVREPAKRNKKKLGSLWGYIGDETALYLYTSTGKRRGQRPGELGPEEMLELRSGYTVADASQLFDEAFKRDELVEGGCNMHARRYFKKALDGGDQSAALVIGAFKALYDIEQRIKDKPPDEKLAVRQEESAPIYDKIMAWCRLRHSDVPPKSALGVAIRYMINHEQPLRRFLEHGAVPLDNGAVERLHIRVALTRKNYLFAGSDAGAERAAIAYTILACCELAEVDPVAYLADVLPRLARGLRLRDAADLLPRAWKAAQS
jgi:transposase